MRWRLWHAGAPRAARRAMLRQQARTALSWLAWPLLAALAALRRRTTLRATPLVAVVGSFGKTTTTRAIAAALGVPFPLGDQPNFWSHLALALLRARHERPLVLEVGISRPGQMRRYAAVLRPSVVVFTGVGSDHREALGSIAAIRDEKATMLRSLPASALAVVNGDDPEVMRAAADLPARVVRFGLSADNDVRATGVEPQLDGSALTITMPGWAGAARVGLLGEPAARAALAALAVARELEVPLAEALARLAALEPVEGRLQTVPLAGGAVLLRDEAKSSPETIAMALATLAALPARRRLVVLGDVTEPGPAQHAAHRRLGRDVARVAERILYTGRHAADVRRGARLAGLVPGQFSEHRTVLDIAAALRAELQPGDIVLLKGRGSQKLGRVALLLQGARVTCPVRMCTATGVVCHRCPALAALTAGAAPS